MIDFISNFFKPSIKPKYIRIDADHQTCEQMRSAGWPESEIIEFMEKHNGHYDRMMKLPDGQNPPVYKAIAKSYAEDAGNVQVETMITEWWHNGKLVEPVEDTANDYFYSTFDKAPFKIISITKVE